jgi:hypothetical protein
MHHGFGPEEFAKRPPRSATILFGALTLVAMAAAVWLGVAGKVALGWAFAGGALLFGVLTWLLGGTSWRFYRDGVVQRRMGRTTELRYTDVVAYAYSEADGGLEAPDRWRMTLLGRRGERVAVDVAPDLRREADLPRLHARLFPMMLAQLREQLAEGVAWGPFKLRRDGVALADGDVIPYGRDLSLRRTQRRITPVAELVRGGEVLGSIPLDAPNLALGAELLREQVEGTVCQSLPTRIEAAITDRDAVRDVGDRRLGWILIAVFAVFLLGEGAYFASQLLEYRALGTAPRACTVEELAATEGKPQWVKLEGSLELACGHSLVETVQGTVLHTSFLASDPGRAHWFELTFRGATTCEQAMATPLVGIAERESPDLPAWLASHGLPVPEGVRDMVSLTVGAGPETYVRTLWLLAIGELFFAGCLAVGIYMVVSRRARAGPARG